MRDLQTRLDSKSTAQYKEWLQRYLRNTAVCRGAKMPDIRACVNDWANQHQLGKLRNNETPIKLMYDLFSSQWNDDKLAACYFVHDVLQPNSLFDFKNLELLENLFAEGKIFPWNVVDTLSARIFPRLITDHKQLALDRMREWSRAESMWQARTSVVALIHFSKDSAFHDVIAETCSVLVKRDERFAKTCVGWMMREVAKADRDFARRFIDDNLAYFSLEAVRNATKHFPDSVTSAYVSKIRQSKSTPSTE